MMRCVFCFFICVLLFSSCKKEDVRQEDVALQAAKAYYDQLLHGDYDSYVEGCLKGDSVAPVYRHQLLLNAQMFMEQQNSEHNGISEVKTLRAAYDSSAHTVDAFLALLYADSTVEEIVVPMVEKNGVWYLR